MMLHKTWEPLFFYPRAGVFCGSIFGDLQGLGWSFAVWDGFCLPSLKDDTILDPSLLKYVLPKPWTLMMLHKTWEPLCLFSKSLIFLWVKIWRSSRSKMFFCSLGWICLPSLKDDTILDPSLLKYVLPKPWTLMMLQKIWRSSGWDFYGFLDFASA